MNIIAIYITYFLLASVTQI